MIHIVRFYTKKATDEGIRLGTVRRPPRGVPKADYAKLGLYETFFPVLSPTPWLLVEYQKHQLPWDQFCSQFDGEMQLPLASAVLDCFATLSRENNTAKRDTIVNDTIESLRGMYRSLDAKQKAESIRVVPVLRTLIEETHFSIGCYCSSEGRCHRGILRQLLAERKALLSRP
jgi:uncharacterized protein YeaO (DUF488 family)